MAELAAVGAVVPHPIVGSWEVPGCTRPAFSLTSWAIGLCFGAYRWHLSRQHEFDDDEHDRAYLETCLVALVRLPTRGGHRGAGAVGVTDGGRYRIHLLRKIRQPM